MILKPIKYKGHIITFKKRYAIISKGLSSKFAHDERYRYRGMVFITKEEAEWHLNNLPYAQQRNMKVVSFIPKHL